MAECAPKQEWFTVAAAKPNCRVFYRYEDRRKACGYFDESEYYHRSDSETTKIILYYCAVVKETRKGVWIERHGQKRWIGNNWTKRYAYPTKQEAWIGFMARKRKQYRLLIAKLASVKSILEMKHLTEEQVLDHLEYETVAQTHYLSAALTPLPTLEALEVLKSDRQARLDAIEQKRAALMSDEPDSRQ